MKQPTMMLCAFGLAAIPALAGPASPRLEFESSHGLFLARTPAHTIYLTRQGMTLASHGGAAISMRLAGGALAPKIEGEDKLAGVSNYLLGSDPKAWQRNVSHYSRVRYAGVYPGIDAVFHGEDGALEYDFVVAAGADPGVIRLSFDNASGLHIDDNGELVVQSASGEMRQHKPVLFQERNGVREPVQGAYRLLGSNQAGFTAENWDHERPLIIDPVLVYSSYVGLSGRALLTGMAVDSSGNTYLAGSVTSPDLPVPAGGYQGAQKGFGTFRSSDRGVTWGSPNAGLGSLRVEAFAIDPRNPAIVYAGTANGVYKSVNSGVNWTLVPASLPPNDYTALAIDPGNSSVVYAGGTGIYKSTDAGATWTRVSLQVGILSLAISKLNSSVIYVGHQSFGILKSTDGGQTFDFLTGSFRCNSVALDSADVLYAALKDVGYYKSTDGGDNLIGWLSGIVSSLAEPVNGNVVVADPKTAGRVYLGTSAGLYRSTNSGVNWTPTASLAGRRVLSVAVDPNDSNLLYAGTGSGVFKSTDGGLTFVSAGPAAVDVNAIAIDSKSQYVLAGLYSGPDAFVSKIAADGTSLVYSTYFGGSGAETASGVVVDASGSVAFCGTTDSIDLPTRSPIQAKLGGGTDIYVARLNASGSDLVFSTYLGGKANDTCTALVQDPMGSLYVVGNTYQPSGSPGSNNYPSTPAAYQKSSPGGGTDCVVSKIDSSGKALVYSGYLGGASADGCFAAAVDSSGSLYLTGSTRSGDFPNTGTNYGAAAPSPTRLQYDSAFVTRLTPDGSGLVFSGYVAGSDSISQGHSIGLGPTGRVYIAGLNVSSDFPITDGTLRTDSGRGLFLTALEPDASALVYSAIIPDMNDALALQIDTNGNAWLAADASSVGTFAPSGDAFDGRPRPGVIGASVIKIDPAGANVLYGTYLAGITAQSHGIALQLSGDGSLYVAGYAQSTDFANPPQSFETTTAPDYALFVEKIDTLTAAPIASPVISAILNAGGLTPGPQSPGAVMVIQGVNLAGNPAVVVNGIAAPVLSFGPQQIVAQIPYETPLGDTTLTVTSNGLASDPAAVSIAAAAPGIYTDLSGQAIAFNGDSNPNSPDNPAPAGSTISVRLTGIGTLDNPVPTGQPAPGSPASQAILETSATVGDQMAVVGPIQLVPGLVGVAEAKIQLPTIAAGNYPLLITIGGMASNPAMISVSGN